MTSRISPHYRKFLLSLLGLAAGAAVAVVWPTVPGAAIGLAVFLAGIWAGHRQFAKHASRRDRIDDLDARLHND